ncbi:hypothetical protein HHI36_012418 [Cryptolaemus montrouzieri]|uniref:Uncharacterized protein n=1 Tax=Cryptolaemus montrouzieri TaxID=559131 RepID=A0ABD2NEE9_9CUCU
MDLLVKKPCCSIGIFVIKRKVINQDADDLSEKTIEKILNEGSDFESLMSGIPEERYSYSEIISGCEDPVTFESDEDEDVDSHVKVSSTESQDEYVAIPSQINYFGKNKYKWST